MNEIQIKALWAGLACITTLVEAADILSRKEPKNYREIRQFVNGAAEHSRKLTESLSFLATVLFIKEQSNER